MQRIPPYSRKWRGTKESLDEGERGEWKRCLKLFKTQHSKTKTMALGLSTSWQTEGEKVETVTDFIFVGSKNHWRQWLQSWNLKTLTQWKESYDKPGQHIKKQRHYFADKGPYSQSYGFFSSPVQMWGLDHKEDWALKNWCFQTVVLEKTLESPLDCKEIKPVKPKGNQPWIFIGRTNAKAPILWPPEEKSWLIGKDPDAGKDWRQREKRVAEDEMVR